MNQGLRRELGLIQAISTVMGLVIGSGIFALPAAVFAAAKAPGLGLIAWLLGALISVTAGLTLAELTALMPKAGGVYVYLREAYGEWAGFLQGWVSLVAYDSGSIAAIAVIFATYVDALIPLTQTQQVLVAVGSIVVLCWANLMGIRIGGWIQSASMVGKLVPLVLLIGFGLLRIGSAQLTPVLPSDGSVMGALAAAVLPVLFAYDGWINAAAVGEETKNPQRNLPLALIGGMMGVGLIYVLVNVGLLSVFDFQHIVGSEKPVVEMAQHLFGPFGAQLLTVGMLISMFGSGNGNMMTAPRYYYAMARDGIFPFKRQMTWLSPKNGTPVLAVILTGLASIILVLFNSFDQLYNLVIFVVWLEVAMAIGAVFILRRKYPNLPRPYKAVGYPVIPLIALAASFWVVWAAFTQDPQMALLGLLLVAAGLPVYLLVKRQNAREAQSASAE
jgi:APA family basic amino acid/polyamine antiporter